MEDLEDLVKRRDNKLAELHRLAFDPLLEYKDSQNTSHFVSTNPIDAQFDLNSLGGSEAIEQLIKKSLVSSLYHPQASTQLKRKAEINISEDWRRKRVKIQPRITPTLSNHKQRKRPTSVKSIRTQNEVSEEEIHSFLTRDISDLEILAVPEHYPTKPHNVSSLAELYYLTQTLPLIKLLPGSHKALMTDNFELALLEGKIAVLYSRIEELKRQGKWSLRQPQRFYDPFTWVKKNKKRTYHWDSLIEEGKWMAADFKESLKFKKSCCVVIAQAIKDFWTYGKIVCVRTRPIIPLTDEVIKRIVENIPEEIPNNEELNVEVKMETEESPVQLESHEPEKLLDATTEIAEIADEPSIDVNKLLSKPSDTDDIMPTVTPYTEEELNKLNSIDKKNPFKLHVDINDLKKIDQSIIKNLPKFTPFDDDLSVSQVPALRPTESPMIPVSRLLHPFEDDDDWYKIVLKDTSHKTKSIKSNGPPEFQKGLFGFQSHRRFNSLKPPKPPLIKNIEYRSPTIWLPQDDKYLIHYVAEFCFNWELISEHLLCSASSLKKYESNIERRTPWQCFERYIQLNEKFQFSDMKGVYSYHAQQWLEQAHKAQLTTKRRISPLGVGSESIQRGHRRLRWASMFDAMRKCMKKREIAAAKITQKRPTEISNSTSANSTLGIQSGQDIQNSLAGSVGLAGLIGLAGLTGLANATNGSTIPAGGPVKRNADRVPTPAELSKLKFERDKSIQEAYINQQATRSRMMTAVAQQQKQQQVPPGARAQQLGTPSHTSNSVGPQQRVLAGNSVGNPIGSNKPSPVTGNLSMNSQSPNSTTNIQGQPNKPLPANAVKRPTTPNGTPYTPEQIQHLLQLQKQRRIIQQQNQGKDQVINNGMNMNSNSGKQIGAQLQNKGGSNQSSPQLAQQIGQVQPSSSGQANAKPRIHFAPAQVSAIINSIQTKNPGFSKEQVTKLAAQYLANLQQQQQSRFNQQQQQLQQQNLTGQQNLQQGSSNQFRNGPVLQNPLQKQALIATLTPQERNQLQMLKAAKPAQQQQLQQQLHQQQLQQLSPQLQQQQLQQLQQRANGSPLGGNLDTNNMSKLEYEQRKKALMQKQQQQRMGLPNANSGPSSPSTSATSPSQN
jgi:Small-conductance mechanosensitive channel